MTRHTWLLGCMLAIVPVACVYAQDPPIENVELEWLKDPRVAEHVMAGDPVFLDAALDDCDMTAVTMGLPTAIEMFEGTGLVTVKIPIATDVLCPPLQPPPLPPPYEQRQSFLIGALPAGTWCVFPIGYDEDHPEKQYLLPGYENGDCRTIVTVAPAGSELSAYHSGVWRDAQTQGEGIFLEVFESGSVFTYMGKNLTEGQLWLVSGMIPPDERVGLLYLLDKGTMNAPSGGFHAWGQIRYEYEQHTRCKMKVEFLRDGAVVKSMDLVKMASPRHQPQNCG